MVGPDGAATSKGCQAVRSLTVAKLAETFPWMLDRRAPWLQTANRLGRSAPFDWAEDGEPVSRIFMSHSSKDWREAVALKQWLAQQQPALANEIFLDLDRDAGIGAGT